MLAVTPSLAGETAAAARRVALTPRARRSRATRAPFSRRSGVRASDTRSRGAQPSQQAAANARAAHLPCPPALERTCARSALDASISEWAGSLTAGAAGPLICLPDAIVTLISADATRLDRSTQDLQRLRALCVRLSDNLQQLYTLVLDAEEVCGLMPQAPQVSEVTVAAGSALRKLARMLSDVSNRWDYTAHALQRCLTRCASVHTSLSDIDAVLRVRTRFVGVEGLRGAVEHLKEADEQLQLLPGKVAALDRALVHARDDSAAVPAVVHALLGEQQQAVRAAQKAASGEYDAWLALVNDVQEARRQLQGSQQLLKECGALGLQLAGELWQMYCALDTAQQAMYRCLPEGSPLVMATMEVDEDA